MLDQRETRTPQAPGAGGRHLADLDPQRLGKTTEAGAGAGAGRAAGGKAADGAATAAGQRGQATPRSPPSPAGVKR